MTALAVALSVIGGLFELAGLLLVALGIARDRQQARRLFAPRPRKPRPTRSYPPKAMPRRYPSFPTLLERDSHQLRKLAEYVSKVDAAAYNAFIDLRKTLDAELYESVDHLRTEVADSDDELREHLRYVLAGSISDRVKGAILLGVGILLSVAGSVVGTLTG